ncbi:FAD-dependent oxidoreductase [Acidimangrovimonas pyrenivorans]|uniref:FAD-dependent oxidoreductase n=1 Tax=Acidimangrovimonas pyrenivorans TaxID=2030798 RepID=A0ABV7AJY8_9RHOB
MVRDKGLRAVVVGAGITGLTSACRLAESGYRVTVIEARDGPGDGSSHANAGQLLFDRVSAMGSPGFLKSLPKTLADRSQGVGALGLAAPGNWPWALAFLRQCSASAWRRNTRDMLELARLSKPAFHGFLDRHPLAFDWRRPGKLIVHPTEAALAAAARTADFQARFGGRHAVLTAEETLAREPALQGTARPIAGAIHLPDAELGDCRAFCAGLVGVLRDRLGGEVRFGTKATGLVRRNGLVQALATPQGDIPADLFVLATGRAAELLPRFRGRKPLVGVRGVSLTYPAGPAAPELSVTDAGGKFVVLRLGDRVRVAGFAAFTDDTTPTDAECALLRDKGRSLMPGAAEYDAAPEAWAGLRPQTPDDLPMIGRAGADNLFVTAGQGSLGWTFAFGSAERLLQAVAQ